MKRNRTVLIVCYLAYTAIYIARLNLSMASPALKADLILTPSQIGLLGSAFSVVYAVGRLFNGIRSDRVAPYRMIAEGLALGAVANLLFGFFPPFIALFLLWGTNAFAQSMLWSSVLRILSALYDAPTAKKKASVMVTSVATGNIAGILINTWVIRTFGVAWAFWIPGALLLIAGGAIVLTTRLIVPDAAETAQSGNLLRNRSVRAMIAPAMMHGMMKDNISLWMAVYIVDLFGVQLTDSAYYVLLIPAIGLLGRMAYPAVARLFGGRELWVSVFGFGCCAVAALPLIIGPKSPWTAVLCLAGIYAAVSLINTVILSIFPLRFAESGHVASVSGAMDFATYLGAGISSVAYGYCIERIGYAPMFASWVIAALLSIGLTVRMIRAERKNVL